MATSTDTGGRLASGRPSRTAGLTVLMRAVDSCLKPDRQLARDSYAHLFAARHPRYKYYSVSPRRARLALGLFDQLFGGFLAEVLLRGRHFDDALQDAHRRGVRQVLLVGAGYETPALRHPDLALRIYEVDHPATQRAKRAVLDAAGLKPEGVRYCPVDLESQRLNAELAKTDFDPTEPCLIGWHGVTFFLGQSAFEQSLADLAEVAAPDSRLVFDYMDPSVVDGTVRYRGARFAARSVARRGEPYRLGLTPATAGRAATAAGFVPVESLRVPDLVSRYGGARPYCRPHDFMGIMTVERSQP